MMIITNKHNYPVQLVEMAKANERVPVVNKYSATELLKGTKEIVLTRRYFHELEIDVSQLLWALWGQACHYIMEFPERERKDKMLEQILHLVNTEGQNTKLSAYGLSQKIAGIIQPNLDDGMVITEQRLYHRIGKNTVSGQFDLLDKATNRLRDWKTASVYKVKKKDYDDWKKQGAIYAWLCKKNGIECKGADFTALVKDFRPAEQRKERNYPQFPIVQVPPFNYTDKDLKRVEVGLTKKLAEINKTEEMDDDDIAPCTPKERWKGTKCKSYCACNVKCNFYRENIAIGELPF